MTLLEQKAVTFAKEHMSVSNFSNVAKIINIIDEYFSFDLSMFNDYFAESFEENLITASILSLVDGIEKIEGIKESFGDDVFYAIQPTCITSAPWKEQKQANIDSLEATDFGNQDSFLNNCVLCATEFLWFSNFIVLLKEKGEDAYKAIGATREDVSWYSGELAVSIFQYVDNSLSSRLSYITRGL